MVVLLVLLVEEVVVACSSSAAAQRDLSMSEETEGEDPVEMEHCIAVVLEGHCSCSVAQQGLLRLRMEAEKLHAVLV